MAEMLLFHHAQGQMEEFLAVAEELRRARHTVHAPDLYDGRTFDTLGEGVAYADKIDPRDQHPFADASLQSYGADAGALLSRRVLDFLATR